MLTESQKTGFREYGFFRIPESFSIADAELMQTKVWVELEKQCGVDRNDPASWHSEVWPKFHEIKFDSVFDSIGSETTRSVLDALLGEWEEPSNWGQFVVSFPKPDEEWKVPHYLWHTDFGYNVPVDHLQGVLLISFINDVGQKSGGTGVVSGSHSLVEKFVESKSPEFRGKMKRVREALMVSEPWLTDLSNSDLAAREEKFLKNESVVDGFPLQVCDLGGRAGDIVIAHPWLLHTSSMNGGNSVSMRRVQRIRRKKG